MASGIELITNLVSLARTKAAINSNHGKVGYFSGAYMGICYDEANVNLRVEIKTPSYALLLASEKECSSMSSVLNLGKHFQLMENCGS